MPIRSDLRVVAASAVFLVCSNEAAAAQSAPKAGQTLLNDIAVTLTSGTVVRIRNIAVFRSPQSKAGALTVYIQTPTPSTQPERLALEAKEIAGVQLKSRTIGALTSVSVAVCRTNGCLEMREAPEELFVFVRKPDGSLEAEKQPSPEELGDNPPLMRITNLWVGGWRQPVCGSHPPQGENIWFPGGDYCEWMTPARGRIVAQRDEQHQVHAVILNRQTSNEAQAHAILDSLGIALRSFGLNERACAPDSSPAGAGRSWLYEDEAGITVHIAEITPPASPPRLMAIAVDFPTPLPRALCH